MSDYDKDLEAYDDEYGEYEVKDKIAERLPEGTYEGKIIEARVERATGDYSNLQFNLGLEVLSGEYEGTVHRKWANLDIEAGRRIVKQDLHTLGLDLERLSDLPATTPLIVGLKVRFRVKFKRSGEKVYTNTYINKLIDSAPKEKTVGDESPW